MKPVLIYGSYGYSGSLIVKECIDRKIAIILAGRDAIKLKAQAGFFQVPFEILDLSEAEKLKSLLSRCSLVIHCAGPFRLTAKAMAKACIETKTHYTDITGEIGVFESLSKLNQQAIEAGIMLLPGAGFDVVPTDCVAVHLKEKLPTATHLQLAFAPLGGGPSRGTAKTAAEGLGFGSASRKNGKLINEPLGKTMLIDFGFKKLNTMGIPWGDVATAWRSTSIPNIEVYMSARANVIRMAKMSNYLGWLLRMHWVKGIILKRLDRTAGPTKTQLEKSSSYVWGKVWDANGTEAIARIETLGGYSLTAKTAALIAEKILSGNLKPGYQTPAMAYGAKLIMEIEGSAWL
jgi:short subunit dehydrogenase-like uncharacterized protein